MYQTFTLDDAIVSARCPIVLAIEEIRGAYETDEPFARTLFSGGNEIVCEDIQYFITQRTIQRARAQVLGEEFAPIVEPPWHVLAPIEEILLRNITAANVLVDELCDLVLSLLAAGKTVSVSVGASQNSGDDIFAQMSELISRANKLEMSSILGKKYEKLAQIDAPPRLNLSNRAATWEDERQMCAELEKLQAYFYDCAIVVAKVVEICGAMMDDITGSRLSQ